MDHTSATRIPVRLLCALGAAALLFIVVSSAPAQGRGKPAAPVVVDAMRGATPIPSESRPPPIFATENKDVRRTRQYAMQPPTIPHAIDGYQVDKDFNRCMACHARTRAQEAGAIPVSVTHYMDRDNNVLAEISPRRYFCVQCHVPQADTKPLVNNTFVDVDRLLQARPAAPRARK